MRRILSNHLSPINTGKNKLQINNFSVNNKHIEIVYITPEYMRILKTIDKTYFLRLNSINSVINILVHTFNVTINSCFCVNQSDAF